MKVVSLLKRVHPLRVSSSFHQLSRSGCVVSQKQRASFVRVKGEQADIREGQAKVSCSIPASKKVVQRGDVSIGTRGTMARSDSLRNQLLGIKDTQFDGNGTGFFHGPIF